MLHSRQAATSQTRGDVWSACSTCFRRAAMVEPSASASGTVPGPEAIAGAIITTEALQRADLPRDAQRPPIRSTSPPRG